MKAAKEGLADEPGLGEQDSGMCHLCRRAQREKLRTPSTDKPPRTFLRLKRSFVAYWKKQHGAHLPPLGNDLYTDLSLGEESQLSCSLTLDFVYLVMYIIK